MIEISIIIPVYNVEKYLEECLTSITKQVAQNIDKHIEVILINDGSTDNSRSICEDYCKRYHYFYLHNQENRGLSAARNQGAMIAKGRYLFFLDSDDYLTNRLQEIVSVITNVHVDLVLGKKDFYLEKYSKYIKSDIDFEEAVFSDEPIIEFQKHTKIDPYCFIAQQIIIKKEFFLEKKLFFKEGIYHEDELWVPMVFVYAERALFLNKSFFCYRIGRLDSIMKQYNIKKEFDLLIVSDELNDIIKKLRGNNKKIKLLKNRRALVEWRVMQQLGNYENDALEKELKKEVRRRKKYLRHGVYIWGYLAVSILGVDATRKCNVLRIGIRKLLKKEE